MCEKSYGYIHKKSKTTVISSEFYGLNLKKSKNDCDSSEFCGSNLKNSKRKEVLYERIKKHAVGRAAQTGENDSSDKKSVKRCT